MEIAKEIGVDEKILKHSWGQLSAKEAGHMGGIIFKELKKVLLKIIRPKNSKTTV